MSEAPYPGQLTAPWTGGPGTVADGPGPPHHPERSIPLQAMKETTVNTEPSLIDLRTARGYLDSVRRCDTLNYRGLRHTQDQLADWMLRHADHLLALADAHAEARQCKNCGGKGRYYVITACDDGYYEKCPKCDGTGHLADSPA